MFQVKTSMRVFGDPYTTQVYIFLSNLKEKRINHYCIEKVKSNIVKEEFA